MILGASYILCGLIFTITLRQILSLFFTDEKIEPLKELEVKGKQFMSV